MWLYWLHAGYLFSPKLQVSLSNKMTSQQDYNLWQLIAVLNHRGNIHRSHDQMFSSCNWASQHKIVFYHSDAVCLRCYMFLELNRKQRDFIWQETKLTSLPWAAFLSGIDAIIAKHWTSKKSNIHFWNPPWITTSPIKLLEPKKSYYNMQYC